MKKFVWFFLLIISFPVYSQYTVKLRFGHISNPWNPYHPTEWRMDGHLTADVFDSDNNLVQPTAGLVYLWERDWQRLFKCIL